MSETIYRDNLIAGDGIVTDDAVLVLGAGALTRGTVLGKITLGAATKAANGAGEAGANTGNGTFTLDATTPILAGAKPGVYTVKVIRAAIAAIGETSPAMTALAELRDPDGNVLEIFDVLTSTGTTIANQIKFVMVEGATPYILGDGFKVTIAAGSGSLQTVNSANVDGSQYPYAILGEDADATSAAKNVFVYKAGVFNKNALVFGGSDTADTHREALRDLGIFLKSAMAK